MMDIEEKISFFLELLSCSHKILYWRFDQNFSLVNTTCVDEDTFARAIFGQPEHYAGILSHAREKDTPFVSSIPLGVEWVSVFEKEDHELRYIHVLGPLFLSEISIKNIEALLNKRYMPPKYRRKLTAQLFSLPVVSPSRFFSYSQMLHYCVTGEKITFVDIQHDSLGANNSNLHEPNQLNDSHLGVYAAELELFKMIEEGNLNYEKALNNAVSAASGGNIDTDGDPVRKSEVMAITFITLSVRAAIRGGLSPATAYNLGDYYESKAMLCNSITDRTHIMHTMFHDFVTRVHNCRLRSGISKPIQTCCDYIDMHLTGKLTLETLANVVGYTEYYLTRKFKKELDITIWDYINKAKVERAKSILANPTYTIQDISDMLNYCSRSYFSEVFQKHTGFSPSDYRKKELMM